MQKKIQAIIWRCFACFGRKLLVFQNLNFWQKRGYRNYIDVWVDIGRFRQVY